MFLHRVELALAGTTLPAAVRTNVMVHPDFRAGTFFLPDEPRTKIDQRAAGYCQVKENPSILRAESAEAENRNQ